MRTEPPATERCPRCGQDFHCGMNDAAPCACTTLTLDAALVRSLQLQYTGCLCMSCLRSLAQRTSKEGAEPPLSRAG